MRHFILGTAVLSAASASWALPTYMSDIPHGTTLRCDACHIETSEPAEWNAFGEAILIAGGANPEANPDDPSSGFSGRPSDYWASVCPDDSDGDGSTNGEELGDPDCVWASGSPQPDAAPSNPGDPEDTPGLPGEGEGEGEGPSDEIGGCAAGGASSWVTAGVLPALLLLGRRRRRR